MSYARTRFWIGVTLAGIVWLICLFLGGEGWELDRQARAMFAAGADADLRAWARRLAWLGEWQVQTAAAVLAAIYLAFARRRRAALLLIIIILGRLLVELQKMFVDRDQPDIPKYLEAVHSMSFPSVHAANAVITYLTMAILLPGRRWINTAEITVAMVLSLLAGWSQLALEQHWTSDVVGGWAFGLLWVMICLRLATDRPGN
jgi:membrane-associated phospholipid phosphatase